MHKGSDWVKIATNTLGYLALCILCMATMLQVIMRYVFNNALAWPEELGRYTFILATYIGIVIMTRTSEHLKIDVLELLLGDKARVSLRIIQEFFCLAYFGIFTWLTWDMMLKMQSIGQHAISMPIAIWTIWAAIAMCSLLSSFYSLVNIKNLMLHKHIPQEERV